MDYKSNILEIGTDIKLENVVTVDKTLGRVGIGTTSPDGKLTVADGETSGVSKTALEFIPQDGHDRNIIFSYDRVSGVYRDLDIDANDVHFNNGGTEKMRITSAGNVGIGTTSPVNNSNRTTLGLQGAWGGQLDIMVGSTVHAQFGTDNFSSGQSARIQSQDGIVFKTNGNNERMRIDSSGNVGIGTNSPGVKLEVVGSNAVRIHDGTDQGSIFFRGDRDDVYIKESNYQLLFGAPSGMVFELDTNSNNGDFFNVTHRNSSIFYINGATGNVGIGTTSPDRQFEVYGTNDGYMKLDGGRTGNHGFTLGSDTYGFIIYDDTASAYRFVIDQDSGNVGIGTTSPAAKLESEYQNDSTSAVSTATAVKSVIDNNNSVITTGKLFDGSYEISSGSGEVNGNYTNVTSVTLSAQEYDGDPPTVGMLLSSASGGQTIPAGTTITGVAGNTLTFSNPVTAGDNSQISYQSSVTDKWGLYINGEAKNYISGNVGIGTTSPGNKLQVVGDITLGNGTTNESARTILTGGTMILQASDNNHRIIIRGTQSTNGTVTGNRDNMDFYEYGGYNFYTGVDTSAQTRTLALSLASDGDATFSSNVGIGTTDPGSKLDVRKDTPYGLYAPGNPQLNLTNTNTEGTAGFLMLSAYYNNTNNTYYKAGGIGGGKETATGNQEWGGYLSFFTTSDGTAGAASGMFEHMRITADGNVGIGTTSPERALHIDANGGKPIIQIDKGGDKIFSVGTGTSANNDDNTVLQMYDEGTEKIRLFTVGDSFFNGGNVGIGVTSPSDKLHIEDSSTANIRLVRSAFKDGNAEQFGNQISFHVGGTTSEKNFANAKIISYDRWDGTGAFRGALAFETGNGGSHERMRIDENGRVGIGTISPTQKLEVNGVIESPYLEFKPIVFYDFNSNTTGDWNTYLSTLSTPDNSVVRWTTAAHDPNLNRSFNFDGGENYIIKIRYKVVSGTPSSGEIFYTTSGHTYSGSYYKSFSLVNDGNWHTLVLDMSSLSAGGTDWIDNTITNIRFDLTNAAGVAVDIDWIAIGGNGYGTQYFEDDTIFDGNVGIGTTGPRGKLDVNSGEVYVTTPNGMDALKISDADVKIGDYDDANGYAFLHLDTEFKFTTDSTEAMRIAQNGNVGIGTTLPVSGLQISTTTTGDSNRNTPTAGITLTRYISGTDYRGSSIFHAYQGISGSDKELLAFAVGPGNSNSPFDFAKTKMVITEAGNVGIGTTSPAAKLDVTGGSIQLSTSGNGVYFGPSSAAQIIGVSGASSYLSFGTIGTEKMRINSSGNVGIGQTNPSTYKLDVTGTIRATGDVIAYSDIRVKENIKTIDNALDKVKALRGVEYNKIDNPEKSIGVIAQEIEEVIPEVVREDDQGMKSVAYGNITAVLIEAIKEQQKQIDELKNQLDAFTD